MNNVMGLSTVPNVAKAMEARGIKAVVNETYNVPLSDATPLVSKAKGRGAEILIASSFFDDMVMIMRAAKAIRYNPKIIWTTLASRIPAWMKELGEDGNYVLAILSNAFKLVFDKGFTAIAFEFGLVFCQNNIFGLEFVSKLFII